MGLLRVDGEKMFTNGVNFGVPTMLGGQLRSLVPWSRLFNDSEILCVINTDATASRTAWVTVDDQLHRAGDQLNCLFSTDPNQVGTEVTVQSRNGKAVLLSVPPGGVVVLE